MKYLPLLLLFFGCNQITPNYDLYFQNQVVGSCILKQQLNCTLHLNTKKIQLTFDPILLHPFHPHTKINDNNKKYEAKQLLCSPKKNGFYCMPFRVEKSIKYQKIKPLNIQKLREIPFPNFPNDQKEISLNIKTDFPIPSDLRQRCNHQNNHYICHIKSGYQLLKQSNAVAKPTSTQKLNKIIEKSRLKHAKTAILSTIELLHQLLSYNNTVALEDIDQILTQKKGDCTEFALLGATILNNINIPARRVYGLRHNGAVFQFHAWVEYYENGYWRGFDPVFRTLTLSISYLLLNRDPESPFIYPDIQSIKMIR